MPASLYGAGLGLRRSMAASLAEQVPEEIDFLELAPENWVHLGGRLRKQLDAIAEQKTLIAHGLSLSIGGPAPLDQELLLSIRDFLAAYDVPVYSEHLSYTGDDGQLYDLLPLPLTEEAVHYTASRIRKVQDLLGRRMAIENVSYYGTQKRDLGEAEFVRAVVEEADCDLLLDVNNVYVNSVNHGYEPMDFIRSMPKERISYLHVAGHYVESDGLIVDTHGADVIDPVWQLLQETYARMGVRPTLLERDFNIPPMEELLLSLGTIKDLQAGALARHAV